MDKTENFPTANAVIFVNTLEHFDERDQANFQFRPTDMWPFSNPRHNNKLELYSQRMTKKSMEKLILFLSLLWLRSRWMWLVHC